MNSVAQTQNTVQDPAILAPLSPSSAEHGTIVMNLQACLEMVSPDNAAWADLRVSEENKYIFPEFQGLAGVAYLKSIMAMILPWSLFRIWEKIMEFGGARPWPGTRAIAKKIGRSPRTVQDNLKALRDLGFLSEKTEVRHTKKDEEVIYYDVSLKDFSALYHFAHEYHEWTRTPLYQLYRPEREHCRRLKEKHLTYEAMHQDLQLKQQIMANLEQYENILITEHVYQKVIRFQNYAYHLTHVTDITLENTTCLGEQTAPEMDHFEETLNHSRSDAPYIVTKNGNSNKNSDSKEVSKDTFTVNKNICALNDNSITLSNKSGFMDFNLPTNDLLYNDHFMNLNNDSHNILNNSCPNCLNSNLPKAATDESSNRNMLELSAIPLYQGKIRAEKEKKIEQNTNITTNSQTIPVQTVTQQYENLRVQNVKDVNNKNCQNKQKEENASGNESDQERKERAMRARESEERLKRCEAITNVVRDLIPQLNDQSPQSTPTTICKVYEASGLSEEDFISLIYYAFNHVRNKLYAEQIKRKDAKGQPVRVPLWIHMIKRVVKEGLAAFQAREQEEAAARRAAEEQKKLQAEQEAKESLAWLEPPQVSSVIEDLLVRTETSCRTDNIPQDAFSLMSEQEGEDLPESSDQPCPANAEIQASSETDGSLVITWQDIQQRADLLLREELQHACQKITQRIRVPVSWDPQACASCGNHLIWQRTGATFCSCLFCESPADWGHQEMKIAGDINNQIPSLERCEKAIAYRLADEGYTVEWPESPEQEKGSEIPISVPKPEKRQISQKKVEEEANELYVNLWNEIRREIRALTGKMVWPSGGCPKSGCKAKIVVGTRGHCACCDLPPELDPYLCDQIRQIVANVPTLEQLLNFAY